MLTAKVVGMKTKKQKGKKEKIEIIEYAPDKPIEKKGKNYSKAPGSKKKGMGIYALFKKEKVVYLGISEGKKKEGSIRRRIKQHFKSKRKKFDSFSFCQLKPIFRNHLTLKDAERIMLKLLKPKYNKQNK